MMKCRQNGLTLYVVRQIPLDSSVCDGAGWVRQHHFLHYQALPQSPSSDSRLGCWSGCHGNGCRFGSHQGCREEGISVLNGHPWIRV